MTTAPTRRRATRTTTTKSAAPVPALAPPAPGLPVPVRAAPPADPVARDAEARARAETAFRHLDHRVHASLGKLSGGLSMIELGQAWGDWLAHLAISPGKQIELAWKAQRKWNALLLSLAQQAAGEADARVIEPLPRDRRFAAPGWKNWPFNVMSQGFLLTQQWWHNATTGVRGVSEPHARLVEFYSRQLLDMVSPSNFVLTNPELLSQTMHEGGANLVRGAGHFWEDAVRRLSGERPAGTEAFNPGETVAATPGQVVFRNELMELIQYAPATKQVHATPLLIVPAWIMKYYILDLSAQNSLIGWLVAQGFTVFCISWKNPTDADRERGFDDYRKDGVMAAIDAVTAITGAPRIHAAGYCLGGTLLSVAAAAMARDGDDRLASMTMLAAQVDFTEAGELRLFINESQLALLEDMMFVDGYLAQNRMSGAFNMLNSRDLVWSRAVHDYLKGQRDMPSDIAAWSTDTTRMPYRMHAEYLRHLFLDNDLAEGRFTAGGKPVMLADISAPVFAVATERDHIAPWQSVFKLTYLMNGEITFVLTSGGHNSGIVSVPGDPRSTYRLMDHHAGQTHPAPDAWAASIEARQGSWWPEWASWLLALNGDLTAPPPMGNAAAGYAALEPAPGQYVMAR